MLSTSFDRYLYANYSLNFWCSELFVLNWRCAGYIDCLIELCFWGFIAVAGGSASAYGSAAGLGVAATLVRSTANTLTVEPNSPWNSWYLGVLCYLDLIHLFLIVIFRFNFIGHLSAIVGCLWTLTIIVPHPSGGRFYQLGSLFLILCLC